MRDDSEKRNIRLTAGRRIRTHAETPSADDVFADAETDAFVPFDETAFEQAADAFDDAEEDIPEPETPEPPEEPEKKARGKKQKKEKPKRPLRRRILRALCFFVLICTVLGSAALAGYLHMATRYDYLWLELEQLPYRDGTVLYAQDSDTDEWAE